MDLCARSHRISARGWRRLVTIAAIVGGAVGVHAQPAAAAVLAEDLGTLGGTHSSATAIDGHTIVGWSDLPGDAARHAFAYDVDAGALRDLGTLGGPSSRAVAVDGRIVVGTSSIAGGADHAFAYDLTTGTLRDLGTLGGTSSTAVDVDGRYVVGNSPPAGDAPGHAFAYDLTTGTLRDLGTLGGSYSEATAVDGHVAVGTASLAGDTTRHAFAYDLAAGAMRDLGAFGAVDTPTSGATDVEGGIVVGATGPFDDRFGNVHAFSYDLTTGTMRDIGTDIPGSNRATAVDGDLVVIGSYVVGSDQEFAYTYDLATGAADRLGTIKRSTWATAVDDGIVVGVAYAVLVAEDVYRRHAAMWQTFAVSSVVATTLTGYRVPGGDRDGWGIARLRVVTVRSRPNQRFCYEVGVGGIDLPVTGVRVHRGSVGPRGPAVLDLPASGPPGPVAGCLLVPTALAEELQRDPGRFSLTVSTGAFPDGALRGHLADEQREGLLLGTTLTAPTPGGGQPGATGVATVTTDRSGVCWQVAATGLTDATAAHLHTGPPGAGGPIAATFTPPRRNGTTAGCLTGVDPGVPYGLVNRSWDYHVDVHTAGRPEGALAGALRRSP